MDGLTFMLGMLLSAHSNDERPERRHSERKNFCYLEYFSRNTKINL